MRKGKEEQVRKWCEEHDLQPLNIRNMSTKCGRTTIVVTFVCKQCGARYDRHWGNLQKQDYPWLCSSCAHRKSQDERRLTAQKLVDLFEKYGYKVLTPIDKIKPVGKNKLYSHSKVQLQDSKGYVFEISWNNFRSNLQYYLDLNGNGHEAANSRTPSSLEQKVINYFDFLKISYKREFKISDCRGEKRALPFDFCLNYSSDHILLIEVDGELHYKENAPCKELHRYDKIKDYYCQSHNIPLLRIPYWEFDDETYKKSIDNFINTNSSNDTIED